MTQKACNGGQVIDAGTMAECAHCGTRVWWNLQWDSFWGFQNCREAQKAADAVDPHVAARGTDAGPRAY